jgi:hypothetical protein
VIILDSYAIVTVGAAPDNTKERTGGARGTPRLRFGATPDITKLPGGGNIKAVGKADTKLAVKITDGMAGRVGLVPAA